MPAIIAIPVASAIIASILIVLIVKGGSNREANLEQLVHVIDVSLKLVQTWVQKHELFVRGVVGGRAVLGFVLGLQLDDFVAQLQAVLQAGDQRVVGALGFDRFGDQA